MPRVLIVEDEPVLAKNVRTKLAAHGLDAAIASTGEEALKVFAASTPDLVLLDVRLPGIDGLSLLPKLKAESPATGVIVMTAHGNERIAVDAMRAGAYEYLTKPVDLEELLIVVNRALEHQQLSDNLSFLRNREEQRSGLDRIIGESNTVRSMKETIRRLTRTEVIGLADPPTVLIMGETGSGKDLVARAIHYEGPRRSKPFIHVNCTALPASLFESELFGHVPGAFTNAVKAKRGLFEVANGGTIFLDEIGHLDADSQAKLLLAIEHRQVRPVGGVESRPVNVHIIAATNRDLSAAVTANEFRRDLYHRLRVIEIVVPPLRSRREDIPLLAAYFLAAHCRRFGLQPKRLADDAIDTLARYNWLGNVRELSHILESAVLQVDGAEVSERDLRLGHEDSTGQSLRLELPGGRYISMDFNSGTPTLDEVEHTILSTAFEYFGRNLSRAARSLGITREALRYRLNKFPHASQKS